MIGYAYTELNVVSVGIVPVDLGDCPASAFDEDGRLIDDQYAPADWDDSPCERGGGIFRTFAIAKRVMLKNAVSELNDWCVVVAMVRELKKPKHATGAGNTAIS